MVCFKWTAFSSILIVAVGAKLLVLDIQYRGKRVLTVKKMVKSTAFKVFSKIPRLFSRLMMA